MKNKIFTLLLVFFLTSIIYSQNIKIEFESDLLEQFGTRISGYSKKLSKIELLLSDSFNKVCGRILFLSKIKLPSNVNSFRFFNLNDKEYFFSNKFEDKSIENIKKQLNEKKSIKVNLSGKKIKFHGSVDDSFAQLFMFSPIKKIVSNVNIVMKRFNTVFDLSIDPEILSSLLIPFLKLSNNGSIDFFDGRIAFLSDLMPDIRNSDFLMMFGLNRRKQKLKEIVSQMLKLLHPTYATEEKYVRKFILFDKTIYFTVTPDRFFLLSTDKSFLYKSEHKVERMQKIFKSPDNAVLRLSLKSEGINRLVYYLLKVIDSENLEIVNQVIPLYFQTQSGNPTKISDLHKYGVLHSKPFFFLLDKIVFNNHSRKFEIKKLKNILNFYEGFGLKEGTFLLKLYRSDTGLGFNVEFTPNEILSNSFKGIR
ncbi:hypothetical protein KAJ27_12735 [bacterium]|nr:hypothetical protein [bacterium]